jgi:hypothetical protein
VPRLGGDQQVEAAVPSVPGLEGPFLDHHAVASGHGGHPGVWLHAEHVELCGGELARRDARPAADVEHGARVTGQEALDECRGIAGAGAIVALGIFAEGPGSHPVPVQQPAGVVWGTGIGMRLERRVGLFHGLTIERLTPAGGTDWLNGKVAWQPRWLLTVAP